MSTTYCLFFLGQQPCAVPLDEVREIVAPPALTPVPLGHFCLRGLANLRGEILSVFTLEEWLFRQLTVPSEIKPAAPSPSVESAPLNLGAPSIPLAGLTRTGLGSADQRCLVIQHDSLVFGVLVERVNTAIAADQPQEDAPATLIAPPRNDAEKEAPVVLGLLQLEETAAPELARYRWAVISIPGLVLRLRSALGFSGLQAVE